MLTREAWVESSESAPGVNLRCRKPLGGTFVSCEGKAAFDNRLCIVGEKKKWHIETTKHFAGLCQNKISAVLQIKENSAFFLRIAESLKP